MAKRKVSFEDPEEEEGAAPAPKRVRGEWGAVGRYGVVMGWLWGGYGALWGAIGGYGVAVGGYGAVMGSYGVVMGGYGGLWGGYGGLWGGYGVGMGWV